MRLKRQSRRAKVARMAKRTGSAAAERPRAIGTLLVIACGATALALLRDARRRNMARDRALAAGRRGMRAADRGARFVGGSVKGAARKTTAPVRHADRDYDDVTLTHKVESEILGPPGAPKGAVSVNASYGVVELRGQVERQEDVKALGDAAAKVAGVKDVHNLLHTPGSPPKHSPISTPEEVRARAEHAPPRSRFARKRATSRPAEEPMVQRAAERSDRS